MKPIPEDSTYIKALMSCHGRVDGLKLEDYQELWKFCFAAIMVASFLDKGEKCLAALEGPPKASSAQVEDSSDEEAGGQSHFSRASSVHDPSASYDLGKMEGTIKANPDLDLDAACEVPFPTLCYGPMLTRV